MAKKPYHIEETVLKSSNRIKELRKKAGYASYEVFALDNNLDRKQYWRAESGANLTFKSLLKIINIHKITLSEFFNGI